MPFGGPYPYSGSGRPADLFDYAASDEGGDLYRDLVDLAREDLSTIDVTV